MLQVDNLSPSPTLTCAASTNPGASASAALSAYGSHNRGVNSIPLPPSSLLPHPDPSLQEQCPQLQEGGRGAGNVLVHWTQSGPSLQSAVGNETDDDDDDDDDDDARAFTPPPPRGRLSYTRYQLELLNGIYQEVRYPNTVQKQLIAKRVGITREQVKIWFQNRRRKDVVGNKGSHKDGAVTGDQKSFSCRVDSSSAVRDVITTSNSNSPPTVRSDDDGSPTVAPSSSSGTRAGGKEGKGSSSDFDLGATVGKGATRMVPEVVMRSVISELGRFSSDKLKSKKDKLKNRQKHQRARSRSASSSSGGAGGGGATTTGGVGLGGDTGGSTRTAPATNMAAAGAGGGQTRSTSLARLFCPYDMVAPPNKVTPTAFLNTSANRFHHSRNTSAFSCPREVRPDGLVVLGNHVACLTGLEGLGAGISQTMGAGVPADPSHHHYPALTGMGVGGVGLMPVSQTQSGGVPEGLPALSDFLGPPHRHPLDANGLGRELRDFPQPHPAVEETGENRMNGLGGAPHPAGFGTSSPSPLTMNRVFPFPLFADPPIVLSNLNQYEPLRGHTSWPTLPPTHLNPMSTLGGRDESYKPVIISSITNPFFAHSSPPSRWPLQHPAPESSSQGNYTQL